MKLLATVSCIVLLVLFSLPAAAAVDDVSSEAAGPQTQKGTMQLIGEKLQAGEIDQSTATKFMIYLLKRPDLLPEDLRAGTSVKMRCGTPLVLEIINNFDEMSEADRAELADRAKIPDLPAILARPTDCPESLASATHNIIVHYEDPSYLGKAQTVLAAAELSYDMQTEDAGGFGFIAPPPDFQGPDNRYDVYMHPVSMAAGTCYPEDWYEPTPWLDKTSWFEVDRGQSNLFLQTTTTHEYCHACQAASDVSEPVSVWEHTSSWVESRVYPEGANGSYSTTNAFQDHPEWALCKFDNVGVLYHYGGMLWLEYLSDRFEAHGNELVPDIWGYCRDTESGNTNHYHLACARAASDYEGSDVTFHDLLAEFSVWRLFTAWFYDPAYFVQGEDFGLLEMQSEHHHTSLPAFSPPPDALPAPPDFFGSNTWRFDQGIVDPNLTVYFQGQPFNDDDPMIWKLGVIRIQEHGVSSSYELFDVPPSGNMKITVEDADQEEMLFITAVNCGFGNDKPFNTFEEFKPYSYMAFNEDAEINFIYVTPGPGPDNPAYVRGFFNDGTQCPLIDFQYKFRKYGTSIATGDIDGDGADELAVGIGPDPQGPPIFSFHELDGTPTHGIQSFWQAYGVNRYGVNLAMGDIDGDGFDEVLTGPGPGRQFGPQVRGFNYDNDPANADFMPNVSFLAYGTNKYGVNVGTGDIDGDGTDEILTGAGPGAVFGPHVRAFKLNGGSVSPVQGVSFFAYGTPRWGVNVTAGDIDGDGIDEIITGAGPGAVYGPHVRGWNYDGGTLTSIPQVSFLAYGTNKYGVNVGCGDVDNDGIDEIITGAGPSPAFGAHVRGWNSDGGPTTSIGNINFFAYDYSGDEPIRYGCRVAVGGYHGD